MFKATKEQLLLKQWISKFKVSDIPINRLDIRYSRSSGAGGQNVQKNETKVELRFPVASGWIPAMLQQSLLKSPFIVNQNTFKVSSQVHRTQHQNLQESLKKVHSVLLQEASSLIVNDTDPKKVQKVQQHMQKQKNRNMQDKQRISLKKANRKLNF